jgi:hypothetical protein
MGISASRVVLPYDRALGGRIAPVTSLAFTLA